MALSHLFSNEWTTYAKVHKYQKSQYEHLCLMKWILFNFSFSCDNANVQEEIPTEKECEANIMENADKAGCYVFRSTSNFNPFQTCIGNMTVEAANMYGDCRYDYCHTNDVAFERKDTICKNIESFVETCDEAGIPVGSWRTILGCRKLILSVKYVR